MTAQVIQADVNKVIGQALSVQSIRILPEEIDSAINEGFKRDCLGRIQSNLSWSNKFQMSVSRRMDDLEGRLNRLHIKLTSLERSSKSYLEKEDPETFSKSNGYPDAKSSCMLATAAWTRCRASFSMHLLPGKMLSYCIEHIRWQRTKEGKSISILTAAPGRASTARVLEQCLTTNRARKDTCDLSKHTHIFRIGLVLAELALKLPISYITYDDTSNTIILIIKDVGGEVEAVDIAAEMERRTNIFLTNMVFFCLNTLQNRDAMADKSIDDAYFKGVWKDAEQLDVLIKADRRGGPAGSGINIPRSGGLGPRTKETLF